MAAKGSVTPMSSVYTHDETQAAEKRVNDAIAGKLQELDRLGGFISDNANLINLVKRLPEQLHHQIMVPFGKAAFFPGKLVHTNEFMVLLGEGYYAETTSKQTLEILKRRAKALESQVNSLNAIVQDLEAEASFFRATASEIVDGIVEIREDYVEESSEERESESESGLIKPVSSSVSGSVKAKVSDDDDEDEEFARIMSRLDVLEKEELEAEADAEANDESDEDEKSKADLEDRPDARSSHELENIEKSESEKLPVQATDFTNELTCTGLTASSFPIPGDEQPSDGNTSIITKKNPVEPAVIQNQDSAQTLRLDSQKAFIGSIIERDSIDTSSRQQTHSQSSKPVSRFKMQRFTSPREK